MLYFSELTATPSLNRGLASPIKEPNVPSATVSETAAVLLRSYQTKLRFIWNKNGDLQNEPTRSGTFGQANAKAYAGTKRRRNCCDACRDVFNWHHRRRPSVYAPK